MSTVQIPVISLIFLFIGFAVLLFANYSLVNKLRDIRNRFPLVLNITNPNKAKLLETGDFLTDITMALLKAENFEQSGVATVGTIFMVTYLDTNGKVHYWNSIKNVWTDSAKADN